MLTRKSDQDKGMAVAAAGDNQGSRLGLKGHCYVDGAGPRHGRALEVGAAVQVAAAVTVWQGRTLSSLGGGRPFGITTKNEPPPPPLFI